MGEKKNLEGTIKAFNTYHTDAYGIAVKNGFEGTEAEWLASLKGDPGAKGDTGAQGEKGEKGDPGAPDYYSTTREESRKEHDETGWTQHIYDLYGALPGVVPKPIKSDDGTVITYEYVISTGEYSTDGRFTDPTYFAADTDIKKPKYLVLSGVHGIERNAVLSVYRFIRDVVYGHNVPQAFKEGVILHILPVGNPSGLDAFTLVTEDKVNINRNFNFDTKAKETQAIINWLKANEDADLFIDAHNGGALNEVVAILGDSDHDAVKTVKKIAMKGVDRIIPFWRDVMKYPDEVEVVTSYNDKDAPNYTDVVLGNKPVIFSYCGDTPIVGSSFWYASSVLSIPSICLEMADYCGDYSDYNKSYDDKEKTATIPQTLKTYPSANKAEMIEAVAVGAEAIGNVLLEFYEQSFIGEVVDDMKVIDGKLDNLLAQVNSGFRLERGVLVVDADITGSDGIVDVKLPCTSGAKMATLQPDSNTYAKITTQTSKADGANWLVGAMGNCVTQVGSKANRGYHCRMDDYSGYWIPFDSGCTCDNTDGFKIVTNGVKAGKYNWTAYYWNE